MIHFFFRDPRTIRRLHQGPLGAHIDALAGQLRAEGYARGSAQLHLRVAAQFSRWLQRQGRVAPDLTASDVQSYLRYRQRQRLPVHCAATACEKYLRLLRDRGDAPPEQPPSISAREHVEEAFARYLAQERGLAPGTVVNYVPVVRQFLRERCREGRRPFATLRGETSPASSRSTRASTAPDARRCC